MLDAFVAPLDPARPSGVELRNDPRFHALERLLLPASRAMRRQNPDSEPQVDWSEVLRGAEEMAAEGRDLRLLVIVARVLAVTEGYEGLAEGLTMLGRTLDEFWDSVHPELRDRPSKQEAAIRRINALKDMENDDNGLLCDLRHSTVLEVRGVGRFRGAEVAQASLTRNGFLAEAPKGLGDAETNKLAAAHEALATRVQTACRALAAEAPDRLATQLAGITAARAALAALEEKLSARVAENGVGVRFTEFAKFLDRMIATLSAPSAQAAAEAGAPDSGGGAEMAAMPGMAPAGGASVAALGPIGSRRDVERMLDLIIEFYERTEPASPIPLLVKRVRKMVPMNFVQLMEEIAPSGLKEFRNVAGTPEK